MAALEWLFVMMIVNLVVLVVLGAPDIIRGAFGPMPGDPPRRPLFDRAFSYAWGWLG